MCKGEFKCCKWCETLQMCDNRGFCFTCILGDTCSDEEADQVWAMSYKGPVGPSHK